MPSLRHSIDLFDIYQTEEPINFYFLFSIVFLTFFMPNLISYNFKEFSIINNLIHLLHSIFIINLYNTQNYYSGTIFSLAFFFSDTIKLVFFDKFYKKIPFIIHHLIAIFVLNIIYYDYNNLRDITVKLYVILEFSNIPLYFNYFIIKITNNNKEKYFYFRKLATIIQLCWYGYYRVFIVPSILFNNWNLFIQQHFIIHLVTFIIYFMGCYWSCNLITKIFSNKIKTN